LTIVKQQQLLYSRQSTCCLTNQKQPASTLQRHSNNRQQQHTPLFPTHPTQLFTPAVQLCFSCDLVQVIQLTAGTRLRSLAVLMARHRAAQSTTHRMGRGSCYWQGNRQSADSAGIPCRGHVLATNVALYYTCDAPMMGQCSYNLHWTACITISHRKGGSTSSSSPGSAETGLTLYQLCAKL